MGLGQKLVEWASQFSWYRIYANWIVQVEARMREIGPEFDTAHEASLSSFRLGEVWYIMTAYYKYALFGGKRPNLTAVLDEAEKAKEERELLINDPQAFLELKMREFGEAESTASVVEFLGTIITEPVVSLFESYAGQDLTPESVNEFARAFHGIAVLPALSAKAVDGSLNALLGERAPKVGEAINQVYWALGLGFLGWQTLAPLLSAGLQPNLERYYNKLYRPERFSPSEVRDLFALGKLSADDLRAELRELGWRDDDIGTWIELAYRHISEGDAWDLYHDGHIDKARMDTQLRAYGYRPADLPLLYKANAREDKVQIPKTLVSTLKRAFKERLIGEDEFRQGLADLNYSQQEINLQTTLIKEDREEEERALSTSQIRSLYQRAIIGRDEAAAHLTRLNYSSEARNDLLSLWKEEVAPRPTRLNRAIITEGYGNGVLSRKDAKELLQSEAGYSSANADLILRVEEASFPPPPEPEVDEPARVSLALLAEMYEQGLITAGELAARPELADFTASDRQAIVSLMTAQPVEENTPLSLATLREAYANGVLDEEAFRQRLSLSGFAPEDILIEIQNIDSARARGRFLVGPQGAAPVSLGLLADFFVSGLITVEDLAERPELEIYSAGDRDRLIQLIQAESTTVDLVLDRGTLEQGYVFGLISRDVLFDRLIGFGLNEADAEIAIRVLEIENPLVFGEFAENFLRRPSTSQLTLALQRELITEDQFRLRLSAQGFAGDAIELMVLNAQFIPPAEPRLLSTSQTLSLYEDNLISRQNAQQRLLLQEYTIEDANLLIEQRTAFIDDTEMGILYLSGLVDELGLTAWATDAGYSQEEILAFLQRANEFLAGIP